MRVRPRFALFAALTLALPAAAQDMAPGEDPSPGLAAAAEAPPPAAPACAAPRKSGGGLRGLLAAANRAGAGDLLSGGSGQILGSGKGGAIAGAVLGGALGAADTGSGEAASAPMTPGYVGGGRSAQVAAVAAGTVVELARAHAASQRGGCAGR